MLSVKALRVEPATQGNFAVSSDSSPPPLNPSFLRNFAQHSYSSSVSLTENLSKIDASLRPLTMHLPARLTTAMYSRFRPRFLHRYALEQPPVWTPDPIFSQQLWGLNFRTPLFNAAGMFKNGDGYDLVARQGAGAYLAGTTTALPRMGNTKRGIHLPFVPYAHSASASNWLGLPNRGHDVVATILSQVQKVPGCPLGASLSADPAQSGLDALGSLVIGLQQYDAAGVDLIELNESCPNVVETDHRPTRDELDAGLLERLEYVSTNFLRKRSRPLPVIVKLSNDTNPHLMSAVVDILSTLGFDGLNVGNTSTKYEEYHRHIAPADRHQFEYFTKKFGGGLSGHILKPASLELSLAATKAVQESGINNFHIIRTGGVEHPSDVLQSRESGVALCQWYTGYFEQFSQHGHALYSAFFNDEMKAAWRSHNMTT